LKKIIKRTIVILLITVMSATLLASCRNNEEGLFEIPEFVFVPEFIDLPAGIQGIQHLVYTNDKVFYTTSEVLDMDTGYTVSNIYSMNIDGTNITKLTGYIAPTPMPDAIGSVMIFSMSVDNNGNIWVLENGYFYKFNVPDNFTGEEWEKWEYYEDLGSYSGIRKLNETGAELLSLDIAHLRPGSNDDYFEVMSFEVDGDGNVYLSVGTGNGNIIILLDSNGNKLFQLDMEGFNWVDRFIKMPDGKIAYPDRQYSEEDNSMTIFLQVIDVTIGERGEVIDLPQTAWDIYPGGGDYLVVFSQSNALYGVEAETGETSLLISWINTDLPDGYRENIIMLPDGRIMLTNQSWSMIDYSSRYELIILTKVPYSELPERIVLTLATLWPSPELRASVSEFNRSNQKYRIHVVDFGEFIITQDDWNAAITRLSTEIIAGRVPDILDLSSLPARQYATRGFLADLYEFIDNDPQISRSDLMEGAFRAAEINGGLYQLFSTFTLNTLIGHPSVLGSNPGWNMQEFQAVLDANPQADYPLGQWLTKWSFLQSTIMFSLDEYVDWTRGTTNFDSQNFIQLLEFANTFPEDFDWGRGRSIDWDIGWPDDNWLSEEELIASGRQIMVRLSWFSDFWTYRQYLANFGGEIVFKGFPTEDRNGSSIMIPSSYAMSADGKNKDGVWEFLRSMLMPDWQRENVNWIFPTNKTVFNERLEEAMKEDQYSDSTIIRSTLATPSPDGDVMWMPPEIKPLTQADADRLFALIDSITFTASWNMDEGLMDIIKEGADDYFNGVRSAADAARIIQSKASIYVSEQS
jgi:ABC-type glycerol-3-phosphate transport system substrate-binding protein